MESEQRMLRRKHLTTYPSVVDANTDELVGRVVDLTTEGIRLVSDEPLPKNTEMRLKMVLPATTLGADEITFNAESVWCARDINPVFHNTGFRMINLDEQDQCRLALLMHRSFFRN